MADFDCRDEVFFDRGQEVLGSVVQGTQMATPDPYDVEQLHAEARSVFQSTLERIRGGSVSKILLIIGEAGCGKTHLIRSLRTRTHHLRQGVVAYVHMTSEQGDYRRYLVRQVVRSLGDIYRFDTDASHRQNALELIGGAMIRSSALPANAADQIVDADDTTLHRLVSDYADALSEQDQFADVDLNTLRIFFYSQSRQKSVQRRVQSFLNGEPLSTGDWAKLAALPADCDRSPMYLLGQLARITQAAMGSPLIICVDQIENSDINNKTHDPFIRAMSTACDLIENVPGLMVLLSCLGSAYEAHAPHLISSYRHRIESDPSPVTLIAARSAEEIRQILSSRLKWLFESVGLQHAPPNSVYPMPEDVPNQLDRQNVRTVLSDVRAYWQRCNKAGTIVEWTKIKPVIDPVDDSVDRIRIAWNDFNTAGDHQVGEDDQAHLELLAWALNEVPNELPERATMLIETASDPLPRIAMTLDRVGADPLRLLLGLCEKDARGNGLFKQITSLQHFRANPVQGVVVIRSTRFPAKGKVADHLASMEHAGESRLIIDEPCWKTLQAMRSFLKTKAGTMSAAKLQEWRRSDRPIAGLPEISAIIDRRVESRSVASVATRVAAEQAPSSVVTTESPLQAGPASESDQLFRSTKISATKPPFQTVSKAPELARPASPTMPVIDPKAPRANGRVEHLTDQSTQAKGAATLPAPFATGPIIVGKTDNYNPVEVAIDPQTLTRHTAIFGANGSGKTVLALTLIEKLLERGVSVVLFDRKGDLATYAVEEAWQTDTHPDENARRTALRQRVDVHLYKPGCAAGRPLVLPLLPYHLGALDPVEREEQARQSAVILCDVCKPSTSKSDMYTTVLVKAVNLLCDSDAERSLADLESLLLSAPSDLLSQLPAHNAKHCEEVGRKLNERRVTYGRLFADQGERLDLPTLLLPGSDPARVRLNIISTQFLDGEASLIWIAQFLTEAGRFIARHPSPRLQSVLMFDEADQYIPHTKKPATKQGMENLLKRARGAGVGILLATQNTGDFDYKAISEVNTVFAGKISAATALEKLRPRLNHHVQQLPKKSAGHFVMGFENQISDIKGEMCLVKPVTVPRDRIEAIAASQANSFEQATI